MHWVTAMRTLALMADDARTRGDLARYLEQAGYHVRIVERPEPRDRNLVWLAEDVHDPAAIGSVLYAWLVANAVRRAVLVTSRPAAFTEIVKASEGRLTVLAAPVFAWQVVDALAVRS